MRSSACPSAHGCMRLGRRAVHNGQLHRGDVVAAQGAAGVAVQAGVPVMLGDADAGPFLERVRRLAQQTVRDLLDPTGGGWANIYEDLARTLPSTVNPRDVAASPLLLEGEAPIGPADFVSADVLVGLLSSLVRYPAAFALKAPAPFVDAAKFPEGQQDVMMLTSDISLTKDKSYKVSLEQMSPP